jgi:hypothetical protein
MTEAEFAEQQRTLGLRIHMHDGVYWETVYPFYCKPAFPYTPFDPGEARPARFRSVLGYSHQVRTPARGNRVVPLMVLGRDGLDGFELMKLPPKKRNKVRRALEQCVVLPITDLGAHLERMRDINTSQALRQEQGAGAETPARRYTQEADAWRAQIRREFGLQGREWWGAYVGAVLAAYLRTYQVGGVRVIQQTKADTTLLKFHPMDALYYTVLCRAAADDTCVKVVNGSPLHPSLNHFKEEFLFKAVNFPYYSSSAWVVEMAKRLLAFRARRARPAAGNGEGGSAKP